MRILTGWDDQAKAFTGERKCVCTVCYFEPPATASKSDCPHEAMGDSDRCVHCGAVTQRVE
jgi:hypothetical protein